MLSFMCTYAQMFYCCLYLSCFYPYQQVEEDPTVVAYIKDRFTLRNTGGNTVLSILNRDIQTQSSSTLTSSLMDSFDEPPSASTFSPLKSEDSDTVKSIKPSKIVLSTWDHVVSLLALQDALDVSGKDLSGTFRRESENKTAIPLVGLDDNSTYAGKFEMMESKLFGFSCLEEELQAYSECNKYNVGVLGEFNDGTTTLYSTGDLMEPLKEENFDDTGHQSSASLLNFPKDSELHKALGPASQRHLGEYLWDSFLVDNTCSSSSLICNADLTDGIVSTSSAKVDDVEYLLEAVVANGSGGANTSNICNNFNPSLTSLEKFVTLSQQQSQPKASALAGDDSILQSNVKTVCLSQSRNGCTPTSASASFKSTTTTFIDNDKMEKECNSVQPRKELKQSNASKRRAKPADNQRPRPRDRQLIQDRIKELRELIPNGVKVSDFVWLLAPVW